MAVSDTERTGIVMPISFGGATNQLAMAIGVGYVSVRSPALDIFVPGSDSQHIVQYPAVV